MIAFERSRVDLENGYIFDLMQPISSSSTTPTSILNSALNLLGTSSSSRPSDASKPCQVLVRLHIAKPTLATAFSVQAGKKIINRVIGEGDDDDTVTCLTWTALLLEQNRPNPVHRLALHRVQTIRIDNNKDPPVVTLADHTNSILFQGKSSDAKKWMEQVEEARRVLGAQLEEEANNSGHYHEKKLQRLEDRKREREALKKQFEV